MKKPVLYYSLRRFPLEATKLKIPEAETESCAALAPEQEKGPEESEGNRWEEIYISVVT